VFIDKPEIARVVHFQGYDPELIPVLVLGVPSMHVCGNFIAELLEHASADKQVFAVQLLGPLAKRSVKPNPLRLFVCFYF
jgi:integrator complex subunit 2